MGILASLKSSIITGQILKALEKLDLNLYIAPVHNTLDSIGLEKKDKDEIIQLGSVKIREFAFNLLKTIEWKEKNG
jgi:hypothetical protein